MMEKISIKSTIKRRKTKAHWREAKDKKRTVQVKLYFSLKTRKRNNVLFLNSKKADNNQRAICKKYAATLNRTVGAWKQQRLKNTLIFNGDNGEYSEKT
ncbi:hypothetical protein T10_5720 [Trichinella papuae]|uniref:Uncharacterized protein n=1 Tax=Trichinella papuae TaxID=268474 RepID=A0A0V1M2S7_9BILA|nr:hypothetical protein T10_5720 [Trichinella papuae]